MDVIIYPFSSHSLSNKVEFFGMMDEVRYVVGVEGGNQNNFI